MQAELVIKKMSELADTSSASLSTSFRNLSMNSQDDNGNNNQSAVDVDYSNNNEVHIPFNNYITYIIIHWNFPNEY